MAIPPLRDLTPKEDVKGGSPRTPSGGIRVADIPPPRYSIENGNGSVNRLLLAATTGIAGLFIGSMLAWWTALQGKGVSQKEMQEYIDRWSQSKDSIIAAQQSNQDKDIGVLQGKQERVIDRLNGHDTKVNELEHGQIEFKTKLDLVANYLEEERKAKK